MICQEFLPSPPLQPYLKAYQLRHFFFPEASAPPCKPYAPRPGHTLIFFPRGQELEENLSTQQVRLRPKASLLGQYTQRTNRHLIGPEFCVLIVEFYPGALYRLTGIPLPELTNTCVDAEAVFSQKIQGVNERLNSTDCYQEMIAIVERFLLSLVSSPKREPHALDTVANMLIEHPQNQTLCQLAQDSFLSTRQFERKFKERLGVSSKLLARVARLHQAFRLKYHHPELDWLSIALLGGYQDYQHLAKDFQNLAKATPPAYFLEETIAPEQRFGLRDSSL